MKIAVVGTGYVGLVTGTCFAETGNEVVCVDNNAAKVQMLNAGGIPIYEPGLAEMVKRNRDGGRLKFTTDLAAAVGPSSLVFIAVGTPQADDGAADLRGVYGVVEELAGVINGPKVVVIKSTVPVGTNAEADRLMRTKCKHAVDLCSNPEFLKEGAAIADCLKPDRVVVGVRRQEVADVLEELYHPYLREDQAFLVMSPESAEMTKYANNAMLATKISFINEIANLCEAMGADINDVRKGIGTDARIGFHFIWPGPGFGGSCFEGGETLFEVDDVGQLRATTFEQVFTRLARHAVVPVGHEEDGLAIVPPADDAPRVLAFDLESGRTVLSPVRALTRRPYDGPMVCLKTKMGRRTRVTADHPVVVWQGDAARTIPASEVQPDDELAVTRGLPSLVPPPALDLIELLRDSPLEPDVLVEPVDDSFTRLYPQFRGAIPRDLLRCPEEIRDNNRMRLTLFRRLRDGGWLDVPSDRLRLYTAKGAGARVAALIPLDVGFIRFLGYYLAEGFIARDHGRKGTPRDRVGLCFHVDEREYIADVQSTLSGLGLKFREKVDGRAHTTYASSRIFAWLLRDVLGCGVRSEDKALPAFAFGLSVGLRLELLRGAFSGDGSLTLLQQGRNAMYEYATVSRRLADGLGVLLQSVNVMASIRPRMMNKSKQPAYLIRVAGYESLRALADVFGGKHRERIGTLLDAYHCHIRPSGYRIEGDSFRVRVVEAAVESVSHPVYSLETAAHTVVVGSGLVLHNCFPKDISALLYMSRKIDRPSLMMQAVNEVNDRQKQVLTKKIKSHFGESLAGKTIAVWGLAFKPRTDDIREAPSLVLLDNLLAAGVALRVHDPEAVPNIRQIYGEKLAYCDRPYGALEGADALVLVTEWPEYKKPDLELLKRLMRTPVVFDGRNQYDPDAMAAAGFVYHSIGRARRPLQ